MQRFSILWKRNDPVTLLQIHHDLIVKSSNSWRDLCINKPLNVNNKKLHLIGTSLFNLHTQNNQEILEKIKPDLIINTIPLANSENKPLLIPQIIKLNDSYNDPIFSNSLTKIKHAFPILDSTKNALSTFPDIPLNFKNIISQTGTLPGLDIIKILSASHQKNIIIETLLSPSPINPISHPLIRKSIDKSLMRNLILEYKRVNWLFGLGFEKLLKAKDPFTIGLCSSALDFESIKRIDAGIKNISMDYYKVMVDDFVSGYVSRVRKLVQSNPKLVIVVILQKNHGPAFIDQFV